MLLTSVTTLRLKCISLSALVIGFSEDDYTGDEGEPGDASRPNTPCTVTVQIIERSLEIPLQIRLTPGEGNATSKFTIVKCDSLSKNLAHSAIIELS